MLFKIHNFLRKIHTQSSRISSVINIKSVGTEMIVRGWVKNVRKLKKNIFFDINDGSSCKNLQIVLAKDLLSKNEFYNNINVGDSLEVIGILGQTPQGLNEINAKEIKIIGKCNVMDGYYPFTPKQIHPPEYVRDYLHLRSRISYMNSIFRIRHKALKTINDYLDKMNFIYIHTPIITENDSEGAGEIFVVRPDNKTLLKDMSRPDVSLDESFFNKKAYLSVSGQLCLEAMTHGLINTYTLSPAFRAENSKSPIHLTEFYMLEAEIGFMTNLNDLCSFIETMLKTVTNNLINSCEEDISYLNNSLKKIYNITKDNANENENKFSWLTKKWEIITYDEAFNLLKYELKSKIKLNNEINYNNGLSKEHELLLVKYFNNTPVFIINWPKIIKPFYMKTIPEDDTKVFAVDLLVPNIGELIGGSLRENDINKLKLNNLPSNLDWYLDLRKYGNIPTGGFGMGFERYLQLITSIKNIRDVIPFPRYPHSCKM